MQLKNWGAGITLFAVLLLSCKEERYIDEPGNLVPKTVVEDVSLPSIFVNGVWLHAEAFGHPDSTLIINIHGGPGSDYRYMLNTQDFADHGYRVVFYDQRGSGLSERLPAESYSNSTDDALQQMYDDLSAVITHYKTQDSQKVYLLGHSWGAMMATAYTGKYPDAVDGLIVCEPGGLKWDDVVEYVVNSQDFSFWGEILNDAFFLDQFLTGEENDHEILDYKFGLLAAENTITDETTYAPGSFWRQGAVVNSTLFQLAQENNPDFSTGIENYTKPVLFIYSELNLVYTDAWAEKISSVYPSVELHKIPGVGHDMISVEEGWNITFPIMLEYFNSL